MDNISRSLLNHCNVDFESETLSTPENSTTRKPGKRAKNWNEQDSLFLIQAYAECQKTKSRTLYSFCHLFIVQVPKRNRWLKCPLPNLLINCPQRKFALNQHVHSVMIDACFSLFLVHDASFMSAAHHCLRHLFRSFSLCFSRICFLYIDRLGASGSLGLIVNKRLDLILCLPLSPISWGFGPLVCLRAFCCLPSCILFYLGCACPFYLLSVADWSRRPRQFPWQLLTYCR